MRRFAVARAPSRLPAAVAACLVALAAPASAHTIGGVGPMSFKTTISSVDPQIPGISVRERGNGAMLDIANTTDTEVVVLGYDQEPYLRIGPAGVFENVRSSATYLNKKWDRSAVPPVVDATAAPLWRQVSTANHARWTDHRIHWMGEDLPPQVSADRAVVPPHLRLDRRPHLRRRTDDGARHARLGTRTLARRRAGHAGPGGRWCRGAHPVAASVERGPRRRRRGMRRRSTRPMRRASRRT